jgi:predicted small secreted protein
LRARAAVITHVLDDEGLLAWHTPCNTYGGNIRPTRWKGNVMKAIAAVIVAAVMGMLAGCNTVEGAGKDVKATGAAVERAADKAKPN